MRNNRKQSILFGNGLNRLNTDNPSWDDLIKDIAKDAIDHNIPNTLKYEAIILKEPYREVALLAVSDGSLMVTSGGSSIGVQGDVVEEKLKKDIAERLKSFESNLIYDKIANLPADHYITTNYDNTLFKAKGPSAIDMHYRQEKLYSIRRHYTFNVKYGRQQYWPMHGNVDSPKSIMLGFDHYCGALSKVESYVKGGYEMPEIGRLESMTNRLKKGIDEIYSWIDLFFISDVHIIGQQLAYEEMDLWWVLNKRRRIKQRDKNLIDNRIVLYPVSELTEDKKQLLKGFDVEIVEMDNYTDDFPTKYDIQLGKMQKMMQST